jgi:hypothetical protein
MKCFDQIFPVGLGGNFNIIALKGVMDVDSAQNVAVSG